MIIYNGRKLSVPSNWLFLLVVVLVSALTACQPTEVQTPTSSDDSTPITVTTPVATQLESTRLMAEPTLMATETNEFISSTSTSIATVIAPLVTETMTEIPTVPPLKKVSGLIVSGTELIVSLDGSILATSNINGSLYVYDFITNEMKWEFREDSRTMTGYTALSFSLDKQFLAGGGVEQDVFVWNMESGELVYSLTVPYSVVEEITFSPDGKYLSVASSETYSANVGVALYDMETGQLVKTFSLQEIVQSNSDPENNMLPIELTWNVSDIVFIPGLVNVLAITIQHHFVQEGGPTWALYLWDIDNQKFSALQQGVSGKKIAVSPNGQLLLVEIDSQLHLLTLEGETETLLNLEVLGDVDRLALTNTRVFARLDKMGNITLWKSSGEAWALLESDTIRTISNLAFAGNETLLLASYKGDEDMPIEVWQINE